jgi:hypothetical protein
VLWLDGITYFHVSFWFADTLLYNNLSFKTQVFTNFQMFREILTHSIYHSTSLLKYNIEEINLITKSLNFKFTMIS